MQSHSITAVPAVMLGEQINYIIGVLYYVLLYIHTQAYIRERLGKVSHLP